MSLREHSTGIPVEFACRSIAKDTIDCKEHADRIADLYSQLEETNCQNNLDLLLNPTTDKTEKLAYNLERKK